MTKNKHHYVPLFYLRFFATDILSPKRINLYNLKRDLLIEGASLHDQCYQHKFYGKTDEVEDSLAAFEGVSAWLLRLILAREDLPPKSSEAYGIHLMHIVFQWLRTKRQVDIQDQMFEGFSKALLEEQITRFTKDDWERILGKGKGVITKEDLSNTTIKLQDGAVVALSIASPEVVQIIDDLEPYLLVLKPHRHLITSDNPVVKYNQYYQSIRAINNTGFASRGLQIFLPLSPHCLLILYDKSIYKSSANHGISYQITDKDLYYINLLQFINADENIFFDDSNRSDEIMMLAAEAVKLRSENNVKITKYDSVSRRGSMLLRSGFATSNVQLSLSFMKVKPSAKRVSFRERIKSRYRRILPDDLSKGNKSSEPPEPETFVLRPENRK